MQAKIESIAVIIEISNDRIQTLINKADLKLKPLEDQFREIQKQGGYEQEKSKSKRQYEPLEKISREARTLLDLQMLDARAIKNRLKCHCLSEIIMLYIQFKNQNKLDKLRIGF